MSDGTVIVTDHQTSGRGQRGNQWITEAKKNLTMSVIFKPTFLAVKEQFLLNMMAALAVCDMLKGIISPSIHIKWPNDILVQSRKICGILIENQIQGPAIQSSVVGIGLNVNQAHMPVASATSLSLETGEEYILTTIFETLLGKLESRFLQLKQNPNVLRAEYLAELYWKDQLHVFASNGSNFEGVISGISEVGRLQVKTNDGPREFDIKEIAYIR